MVSASDMDFKNSNGVSVIICCYNSALRLPLTLQHLADQIIPDEFLWEIIVVNNASTDDTAASAIDLWKQFAPGSTVLKVIDELKPGQMYARITGATAARFDNLVFCDDDNLLDKNYVWLAQEVLLKDEHIGAAGGQNYPVTNAALYPDWFEEYKDKYAIGIPAAQSGDVSYKGFVLGAGLITRRHLFLASFDPQYPSLLPGRNGEKLSTGDDFEYCKRLLLRGYKLQYDDRLLLQHFIPKERLTLDYRERLMAGIREAGKILSEYDLAIKTIKRIKHKNRFRLLLLSPFRIFFARTGLSKRNPEDEKLTLQYLLPLQLERNKVRAAIKKFVAG